MTNTLSITHRSGSYPIYIGEQLLTQTQQILDRYLHNSSRIIFLFDEKLPKTAVTAVAESLSSYDVIATPVMGGEPSKSFKTYEALAEKICAANITRNTLLIAMGGGTIGDLGGFLASTLLRGIPLVHIPTTLLAMVDSTIGGKTGINSKHGKNLIGTFYPPNAVLIDTDTLHTLSDRHYRAAYAEIIKYGIIYHQELFSYLEKNTQGIVHKDPAVIRYLILESLKTKQHFVEEDETEQHMRALLNLGHTFGHALEIMFTKDEKLIHGEAIAIGMVLAAKYAEHIGLMCHEATQRIVDLLEIVALPTAMPAGTDLTQMVDIMKKDKKNLHDTISLILPQKIGAASIHQNINPHHILLFLEEQHA